jgi:hypothetical protein
MKEGDTRDGFSLQEMHDLTTKSSNQVQCTGMTYNNKNR